MLTCWENYILINYNVYIKSNSRLHEKSMPLLNPTSITPMNIALYQPDIAGNTGTIIRTCACLGLSVHIIEPAGFDISDRAFKRSGMDYIEQALVTRHIDFDAFNDWRKRHNKRLILATTKTSTSYTNFEFLPQDVVVFGRESCGVPDGVHICADARITITMNEGTCSLNLAVSVGIIAGEAVRQLKTFEK
jgi:tRNA (cytidine/uridine-2'-O-)-methyltransferase